MSRESERSDRPLLDVFDRVLARGITIDTAVRIQLALSEPKPGATRFVVGELDVRLLHEEVIGYIADAPAGSVGSAPPEGGGFPPPAAPAALMAPERPPGRSD